MNNKNSNIREDSITYADKLYSQKANVCKYSTAFLACMIIQSKYEGKDQESIQSGATSDPGHQKERKYHTQQGQEVSPFSVSDHTAAMNRQESMTNTKHKLQKGSKKLRLGTSYSKKLVSQGLDY